MTVIDPCLTFDGNCEEAFEFYRSVFGGEHSYMQRFSDGPPEMLQSLDDGARSCTCRCRSAKARC